MSTPKAKQKVDVTECFRRIGRTIISAVFRGDLICLIRKENFDVLKEFYLKLYYLTKREAVRKVPGRWAEWAAQLKKEQQDVFQRATGEENQRKGPDLVMSIFEPYWGFDTSLRGNVTQLQKKKGSRVSDSKF